VSDVFCPVVHHFVPYEAVVDEKECVKGVTKNHRCVNIEEMFLHIRSFVDIHRQAHWDKRSYNEIKWHDASYSSICVVEK
jgi:hypothetical protein